jgi:hypothetical protein
MVTKGCISAMDSESVFKGYGCMVRPVSRDDLMNRDAALSKGTSNEVQIDTDLHHPSI